MHTLWYILNEYCDLRVYCRFCLKCSDEEVASVDMTVSVGLMESGAAGLANLPNRLKLQDIDEAPLK